MENVCKRPAVRRGVFSDLFGRKEKRRLAGKRKRHGAKRREKEKIFQSLSAKKNNRLPKKRGIKEGFFGKIGRKNTPSKQESLWRYKYNSLREVLKTDKDT